MPETSIIIPAFNAGKFITSTVESVRKQTFSNWELIIVNDGSKDKTPEIIEQAATLDKRIKVIHQENSGLPSARNKGFSETSCETPFIIFLDSDDILEPDALERLREALENNPDKAAAHGKMRLIDSNNEVMAICKYDKMSTQRWGIRGEKAIAFPPDNSTNFNSLAIMNNIPTPGQALIRRKTLETIGLFDTSFKSAEDWDLWLRITSKFEIVFIDRVVLNYRKHPAGMTNNNLIMNESVEKLYKKFLTSNLLNSDQKKILKTGYIWRNWYISNLYLAWTIEAFLDKQIFSSAKQFRHMIMRRLKFYLTRMFTSFNY